MTNTKELLVRIKPNSAHYEVYFKGGGELPKSLEGLFVRKRDAEMAIMKHTTTKVVEAALKQEKVDKKEYTEVRAKRVEQRKAKKDKQVITETK